MAMPTKNSAEDAESPTKCVVATERLQMVVFPATSGTWLNLRGAQKAMKECFGRVTAETDDLRRLWFSPEGVVKVGVKGFVRAVATKHSYDVLP